MNFSLMMIVRWVNKSIFLALIAATVACTDTFDIEFPEEDPQLVVYGFFHPDSVWQVQVGATKSLNTPGAPYPVVDEATVEIYRGSQLVDVLDYRGYLEPGVVVDNSKGITYDTVFWRRETEYRSRSGAKPEPGVDYTLRVSAPGYPSVEATDRIPARPVITLQEVDFSKSSEQYSEEGGYAEVTSVIQDDPEQNNYYLAGASYLGYQIELGEDNQYRDTAYYQEYLETEMVNLQSVPVQRLRLFSDQSFYGIAYPVKLGIGLNQIFTVWGFDRMVVHWGAVSEAFYRYYESLEAQGEYGVGIVNLTDPPKAYSNVTGGLGVFAGYTTIDFPVYRE